MTARYDVLDVFIFWSSYWEWQYLAECNLFLQLLIQRSSHVIIEIHSQFGLICVFDFDRHYVCTVYDCPLHLKHFEYMYHDRLWYKCKTNAWCSSLRLLTFSLWWLGNSKYHLFFLRGRPFSIQWFICQLQNILPELDP